MNRWLPALLGVCLLVTGARTDLATSGDGLADGWIGARELTRSETRWVRRTLASMSLREKAAQLVMVRAYGRPAHPRSREVRDLMTSVRELKVGGIVLFSSELESMPSRLDELQEAADVPLLVAADLERSLAFRVDEGTVPIPYAMAIGATRSTDAAFFAGEVTAREALAVGIHWALAPVADVNNNPANPVIHLRSFGEDPELVSDMAAAFVDGARAGGLMTTAKHFPGHGDTATDSHTDLPILTMDRNRLESVEWLPFRDAIDAGIDSIMLGHISVPAIDPSGTPATLSVSLAERLLRDEMGFEGLIVTDALEMDGLEPAWTGETAVGAVLAGADVLLLPNDPKVAIDSLVRAVREERLTAERIEHSARRVLEAKARMGLADRTRVDRETLRRDVGRPEDVARAQEIARDAITLVRNRGDVLPLAAEEPLRLLHVVISSGPPERMIRGIPEADLLARKVNTTTFRLRKEVSSETLAAIAEATDKATHVLVSSFIRVLPARDGGALPRSQARLFDTLLASGKPVIVTSFGSPYLLTQIPETPVYLNAYGSAVSSQQAAIAAIFGENEIRGKLPITLPDLYPYGHGLINPARLMTLEASSPEDAGFHAEAPAAIDAVIEDALARQAFPGAVVAVGHRGKLAYLKGYGKLSYDEGAAAVEADSIYDLASLTKVVATTSAVMRLANDGRLGLDKPIVDFLPKFQGPDKHKVTVRHLLTHSSGIDWWAPLFKELKGQEAYVDHIQAMDLVFEPGSQTKYSDLGIILLGEIVERVSGQSLDEFVAEQVFDPLGMTETFYLPASEEVADELLVRIAPTEDDPWRGRVLRGEVHDENAHALGGVAPHAGLFSTAGDLARFAQMILNGGVFEHRRFVSRWMIKTFTTRAEIPDSTRALGWDTKSEEGSSAGTLFSPDSFGHTGYTGTSLWIDPDRELFVILLTNRVHPSRENVLIRQVRPALADAVVRGLVDSD